MTCIRKILDRFKHQKEGSIDHFRAFDGMDDATLLSVVIQASAVLKRRLAFRQQQKEGGKP